MNRADTLRLEGELTIYRAQELRQCLLAALAGADELRVDLGAVREIDTAGVQVLIAAKMAALAAGKSLRLVEHSLAVLEVVALLDLAALFGDPLLMTSPEERKPGSNARPGETE